jgi:hypothetical protein
LTDWVRFGPVDTCSAKELCTAVVLGGPVPAEAAGEPAIAADAVKTTPTASTVRARDFEAARLW